MSARKEKAARREVIGDQPSPAMRAWARRVHAKRSRNAQHRAVTNALFEQFPPALARAYSLRGQWYQGIGK